MESDDINATTTLPLLYEPIEPLTIYSIEKLNTLENADHYANPLTYHELMLSSLPEYNLYVMIFEYYRLTHTHVQDWSIYEINNNWNLKTPSQKMFWKYAVEIFNKLSGITFHMFVKIAFNYI